MSREDLDLSVVRAADQRDEPTAVDAPDEPALRPQRLADFVGQPDLKERLSIILEAARARREPPDHLLFAGPPGLGKTTLAGIVANELDVELQVTSGPALVKPGDVAAILSKVQAGDVLFVDEIHRVPTQVEEVLYPAMEDLHIDVVIGDGPAARTLRMPVEPFTLVGATTRTGLITGPLRDRFGDHFRLDFYSTDDLQAIVLRAASILGITIAADAAREIASRSRRTPRIANRLLRRVRDWAEVRGTGVIDLEAAHRGLSMNQVDEGGLDKVDRLLLTTICENFDGGPVGLSNLSISLGEPKDTVEDVIEPFLIQQGYLVRTPAGRVATPSAWRHLDLPPPGNKPPDPHLPQLFDNDSS